MKQDLYYKVVDYITENQDKFYRLAFSYVRNQDDALDVVQNAIYNALEHYGTLRNADAIKTWFYRIVVNESLLFLKKRHKEVLTGEEEELELFYYEKSFEPEHDLLYKLKCLDEETQNIIKLRFFDELALKEIAEETRMNLNTVKAKLYRGLKVLKENMMEVNV